MLLVVTSYLRIRRKSKESKDIDPSGVVEIRRRSHWSSVLSTSSRARTGLSGLPCSRSGRFEKGPSMIHDSAFFQIFSHIFSPRGADSSFQMRLIHTHTHTHRKVDSFLDIETVATAVPQISRVGFRRKESRALRAEGRPVPACPAIECGRSIRRRWCGRKCQRIRRKKQKRHQGNAPPAQRRPAALSAGPSIDASADATDVPKKTLDDVVLFCVAQK